VGCGGAGGGARLAKDAEHAPVVGLLEAGQLVETEVAVARTGVAAEILAACEVAEAEARPAGARPAPGAGEAPGLGLGRPARAAAGHPLVRELDQAARQLQLAQGWAQEQSRVA